MDTKIKRHMPRILCVLAAIILWLFVTYTEDPEMELWLRDIPLSHIHTETLSQNNLTITEREYPETMDVKVRGRRSALLSVQIENLQTSVDYTSINKAGDYTLPIDVRVIGHDLRVVKQSVDAIRLTADSIVTVEKNIRITSSGAETLGIREFTASPASVRITGAKSLLENLQATIHVDLQDKNAESSYNVTLQSASNLPFTDADVKIDKSEVTISAVRALPVSLSAADVPDSIEIERVECTPETVEIRGKLEDIVPPENAFGSYAAWLSYGTSPAACGNIPLVFPDNVEVLGPTYASAKFYFHYK